MTVNLQDPLPLDIPIDTSTTFSDEIRTDTINCESDRKCAGSEWVHQPLAQVRIRVFRGHDDSVTSCQFCDNDTKMLSASNDSSLMLWDTVTGEQLASFNGAHRSNISQARMSHDTTRIVSGGWDQKMHTWNTETGQLMWTGIHGGIVTCCSFSADGRLIISGSDLENVVRVWDAHSGQLIHKIKGLHTSTVTSCAFSASGDRIITTSMDRTTKFWDLVSNRNTITLSGHINIVSGASLTHDERWLATVSWDKNIHISDVSTGMYRNEGAQVIEKAHEGCISSCHFSPDGQQLVTGGYDARVCIWDVGTSTRKIKLQGHVNWVEDVCFSEDQQWVLSCSKDKTVRLWNIHGSPSTDDVPLMEKKRAFGMNLYKCEECGKSYSVASQDSHADIKTCVMCRLQLVKERDLKTTGQSNAPDDQ